MKRRIGDITIKQQLINEKQKARKMREDIKMKNECVQFT